MPTVVAAVVRRGRAFSGGAVAHGVGDVGGRRDGSPRPFGCHTVMIRACAHVWPFRHGGARSSVMDVVACS
jgi:hypothetical protein